MISCYLLIDTLNNHAIKENLLVTGITWIWKRLIPKINYMLGRHASRGIEFILILYCAGKRNRYHASWYMFLKIPVVAHENRIKYMKERRCHKKSPFHSFTSQLLCVSRCIPFRRNSRILIFHACLSISAEERNVRYLSTISYLFCLIEFSNKEINELCESLSLFSLRLTLQKNLICTSRWWLLYRQPLWKFTSDESCFI